MLRSFVWCAVLALGTVCLAADTPVTVFGEKEGGYGSVRIPALLTAKDGTVLAFAEGRAVHKDQAANDIILRRSTDGGKTWAPLQRLADMGKDSLNNPCPVLDTRNGRIHLFFQQYPSQVSEFSRMGAGCTGSNTILNWVMTSDDAGATWSAPRENTCEVKRPTGVTTIASGPGNGIQIQRGAHAGRLLIPFNEGPVKRWRVYAAYSDDGGKTWAYGEAPPGSLVTNKQGVVESQVNEVQFAELQDGSILLNTRSQTGVRFRRQAISRDGGVTWEPVQIAKDLHDDPCMASVFAVDGGKTLYFSGPSLQKRSDGKLMISKDGGSRWTVDRVIRTGPFAYSSLAELSDGSLGCLYETGEKGMYERIDFLRMAR